MRLSTFCGLHRDSEQDQWSLKEKKSQAYSSILSEKKSLGGPMIDTICQK
jgi:hypothetical protein